MFYFSKSVYNPTLASTNTSCLLIRRRFTIITITRVTDAIFSNIMNVVNVGPKPMQKILS